MRECEELLKCMQRNRDSQANMSTLSRRNSISACFSRVGNCATIWKNFSGSVSIIILSKSSQLPPSVGPPPDEAKVLNCYKGIWVGSEDITSSLCKIAATMHCLATDWLPRISLTRHSKGYFTFWYRVEETAPKTQSHGLATMAV